MSLAIGIIGMLCILVAFVLDEFSERWHEDTLRYNLLNLLGSGLLVYYAYTLVSWPFIILNLAWFAVAGYKVVGLLKK